MGNRGSKSNILSPQPKELFVKEQRVDGSCFGILPKLRCTLMGFERNYQVKNPSKQFKKLFSTQTKSKPLVPEINPWFLTGFTDAEGCFSIKIHENAKLKSKWRVRPVFTIILNIKDLPLLESIKKSLGVGRISRNGDKAVMFAVDSIKEIPVIIKHFDKYPLVTVKLLDYLIFKKCFDLIINRSHLTKEGLLEIIGLKSNLNKGLPVKLKEAFPNIKYEGLPSRGDYKILAIPNPFWISGFSSGEGSFQVLSRNSTSLRTNDFFTRFSIHLHIRDLEVLKAIFTYFNIDKKVYLTDNSAHLQISKFSDVNNIIIPFFNKHPILGVKSLDFIDFKKVSDILNTKEHLASTEVFNQVIEIKKE